MEIDTCAMRDYLEAKTSKKYFVKKPTSSDNFFDSKQVDFFRQMIRFFPTSEISKCFEPDDQYIKTKSGANKMGFKLELYCMGCDKIFEKYLTKTSMLAHLKALNDYEQLRKPESPAGSGEMYAYHLQAWRVIDENICKDCEKIKKEAEEEKQREEKISNEENEKILFDQKADSHIRFLQAFLDPESEWKKGLPFNEKWKNLTYHFHDRELTYEHIREMKYQDFLKTPYWKAISEKKKRQANWKCELCNSQQGLQTHHKTYENHGSELYNLQDLIVLCHKCHDKFHTDEPKND